MKPPLRAAFSLLEVMLATAILLGCVIVLAELANIGREHADAAHELGIAQRFCENKLNEMLAGIMPIEEVDATPLEEEDGWLYSVTLESTPHDGLMAVRVTVSRDPATGQRAREFSLVQWVAADAGAIDWWAVPEPPTSLPDPPARQMEELP